MRVLLGHNLSVGLTSHGIHAGPQGEFSQARRPGVSPTKKGHLMPKAGISPDQRPGVSPI